MPSQGRSRNGVTTEGVCADVGLTAKTNVRTEIKCPVTCDLLVALGCSEPKQPKRGGTQCHWPCPWGSVRLCWAGGGDLGAAGRRGGTGRAAPRSPAAFLSAFSAPTPVTDIRTDKVEQKSISLSWQEPGFPTPNGTEYEVKYYEKVGAGGRLGARLCPGRLRGPSRASRVCPSGARCCVCRR